MTQRATLLTLVALFPASGCGDNAKTIHGVDTSDPKEVARAYMAANYDCGDQGVGLQYELVTPNPKVSREEALADERANGCQPRRIPEIRVTTVRQEGEVATVEILVPDDPGQKQGATRLVKTADGWRVDTGSRLDG